MVEPTGKPLQNGKGIVARPLIQAGENISLRLANFSERHTDFVSKHKYIGTINEVETSTQEQTKQLELLTYMRDLYERASLDMA